MFLLSSFTPFFLFEPVSIFFFMEKIAFLSYSLAFLWLRNLEQFFHDSLCSTQLLRIERTFLYATVKKYAHCSVAIGPIFFKWTLAKILPVFLLIYLENSGRCRKRIPTFGFHSG